MHFPHHERVWVEALMAVRVCSLNKQCLLAPSEFAAECADVVGYEYAELRRAEEFAGAVVHKGELARVPSRLLATMLEHWVPVFANEVFVVLSAREVDNNYQPDIHYHSFVRDALHYALHPPERNAPRKAQLVLAPGDLGAKSQGGAYNGSIIKKGAEFLGLFRAEAFAEGQPRNNTSATPMLVTFDVAFNVQSVNALNHLGSFGPLRVEDFRLLRSPRGDLLVNHPVVTPYQRTHQFLSRVEFASLELVRWLRPKPDIPLQAQEKNWVYWYHQQELMLLYSLSPFRVLKQTGGDDFVTVCSEQVDYPWTHRGFMSCSTNPVSFDDEHYVLFFHDRDRQRVYRQGAVLLSKRDLRPVYCSTREFFAGEENFGLRPGIIYTMSCTPVDSRFLLCHGEGDSCTSINWLSMDEITSSMTRVT